MNFPAQTHPLPIGSSAPGADDASVVLARHLDDPSSLAWVHDELRSTLASAQKLLRRYLRESESHAGSDVSARELGSLRQARALIHQGVGATTVIGALAAARVLGASDAALRWALERPARLDAALVEHIEQASFAVVDFLGRELAGNPVPALWLFPQMRVLLETAGADRVHPADLWQRPSTARAIPDAAGALARPIDERSLSALEQLTLANIKTPSPLILARISDLCAGLALAAPDSDDAINRTVWQLAAAVFEALAKGLLQADVFSKRLASRLLSLMRGFLRGSPGSPAAVQQLAHDLLFFCAQSLPPDAARPAPRLAAVRQAYALEDVPRVDYLRSPLGTFDPALVVQARKRVASAKTVWSSIAGGDLHHQSSLIETFSLAADSLRRLFPDGTQLADQLEEVAARSRNQSEAPAVGLAMEVATALLYVEAALEESEFATPDPVRPINRLADRIAALTAGGRPQPLEPWIEALYGRVADRQTLGTVVQELRASLAAAEQNLDRYFRDRSDVAALRPVPAMLQSMRGVLAVLGVDQAATAMLHMRAETEALLGDDPLQVASDRLQRLAANVGALGFLFDMLGVQPALSKAMFRFDVDSGRLLTANSEVPAPAAPGAEVDAGPVDVDAEPVEQVPTPLAAMSSADEPSPSPAAEPIEAGDQGDRVSAAAVDMTDAASDPELSAIFNDEAAELLQDARARLAAWRAEGSEPATLVGLRRGFHTLKGSARMVGRTDIGDLAWEGEQRFNERLADEAPGDDADAQMRDWSSNLLDRLNRMLGHPVPHSTATQRMSTTQPGPFEATALLLDLELVDGIPTDIDLDITVRGELDFDLSWNSPVPSAPAETPTEQWLDETGDASEEPALETGVDDASPAMSADPAPQPLGMPPDLPSAADLDLDFDSRPGELSDGGSLLWNDSVRPAQAPSTRPERVSSEFSDEDIGRSFALPPTPPGEDLSFLSLDLSDPPAGESPFQLDAGESAESGADAEGMPATDDSPAFEAVPTELVEGAAMREIDPADDPVLFDLFDGFSSSAQPVPEPAAQTPPDPDFVDLALDAPELVDATPKPLVEPASVSETNWPELAPEPPLAPLPAAQQAVSADELASPPPIMGSGFADGLAAIADQASQVFAPAAAAGFEPPVGSFEPVELVEPVEPVASVEQLVSFESFEPVDSMEPVEVESVKAPEPLEPLDFKPVESVEPPHDPQDGTPREPVWQTAEPVPELAAPEDAAAPIVAEFAPAAEWPTPWQAPLDRSQPDPVGDFNAPLPDHGHVAWEPAPWSQATPFADDNPAWQTPVSQHGGAGSGSEPQPVGTSRAVPSQPSFEELKVIGPLRVPMSLFNSFLDDAEESSRLLCSELAGWAMNGSAPVSGSMIARANGLALNSASVSFDELSELARQLENALRAEQVFAEGGGVCDPDDARLFSDVAEEIRLLLHQFAAGFLRSPAADLLQRLSDHRQLCEQRARAPQQPFFEPLPGQSPWQQADVAGPESPVWQPAEPVAEAPFWQPAQPVAEPPAWQPAEPIAEAPVWHPIEPIAEPPDWQPAEPTAESPVWQPAEPSVASPVWLAAEPVTEPPVWQPVDRIPEFQAEQPDWSAAERTDAPTDWQPESIAPDEAPFANWLIDIEVDDHVDTELFPIFEEEAQDLLPQLAAALRDWTQRPDQPDGADAAMRHLHTFKGGARLAGAMRLGELAHRLESRIAQLSISRMPVRRDDIDILLAGSDAMQQEFERLRDRDAQAYAAADAQAIERAAAPASHSEVFTDALDRQPGDRSTAEAVPIIDGRGAPSNQPPIDWARFQTPAPPAPLSPRGSAANQQASVRIRASLLERMVNQAGEVNMSRARIEVEMGQVRTAIGELGANVDRLRQQLHDIELQAEMQMSSRNESARAFAPAFDPLEIDRFTRLQELARMMTESVNDVATVHRSLKRNLQRTEDELAAQTRLTRELQSDLLRTRMVEFDTVAERLHRVVRQAANECGKPAELQIFDGKIELDRSVLDRLTPAVEHLLRNAVIHGIESADTRRAAGKPALGNLQIRLHQQGNEVSIDVVDDGAGLDLERIRSRARELGEPLIDGQETELIFSPGFSTAERLTESAGRGVGLDVVRNELMAIDGQIEVSSSPGQGCLFSMLLPLTTATTQVLMLRCGELSVAVPATLVERVRRVSEDEWARAQAVGTYAYGEHTLPIFWLGALLLNSSGSNEPFGRTRPMVIVHSGKHRLALHVDEVLGQQEAVVKNLGPQLSRLPGLAGMSMLASGAVALIYNPLTLAAEYAEAARGLALRPELPLQGIAAQLPLILVVDDSLTVRRVTQRLLLREGYRVGLAKDGLEALEQIAQEMPQLVLSDIEMPRMDGYELVEKLRANELTTDLPVVMITSRIADKHRVFAESLGVARYLGKPYGEAELLGAVSECLQRIDVA